MENNHAPDGSCPNEAAVVVVPSLQGDAADLYQRKASLWICGPDNSSGGGGGGGGGSSGGGGEGGSVADGVGNSGSSVGGGSGGARDVSPLGIRIHLRVGDDTSLHRLLSLMRLISADHETLNSLVRGVCVCVCARARARMKTYVSGCVCGGERDSPKSQPVNASGVQAKPFPLTSPL